MPTQQVVTTSKRFSLNLSDWTKGLLIAILAPVLQIIIASIDAGTLTFNWSAILKTALAAGLAYLLKNLLDSPKIVITGSAPADIEAVKDGAATVKVVNT